MNVVIIVAAGKGARMGVDKLWLEVDGTPILGHTWRALDTIAEIDQIIIAARDERHQAIDQLAAEIRVSKPYELVSGGAERQDSVWNGLEACPESCKIVAIHDAARPCAHPVLVRDCLKQAHRYGAVVAGRKITDTIKRADDSQSIESTVDREGLWAVQTPQVFRLNLIREAAKRVRLAKKVFTDDTAACEYAGIPVKIVPSDYPNPKVTYPDDLPYVSWLLANQSHGV
jgi:2-C-methyl-D-erythritol 4-phosphate cytidylyltransferase